MITNPLLEEIWAIKARLDAEAGGRYPSLLRAIARLVSGPSPHRPSHEERRGFAPIP